ncbi:MAG: DUF4389 domain-containing protein [Candidatus Poribacteria bacterium]
MGTAVSSPGSPIKYSVEYPERLSRGILLLRTFLGVFYACIPHGIILSLYGVAVGFVQFIAWWMILFTGKFPKGMFDFCVAYMRWSLRYGAYMGLFSDKYPPFSGEENVEYPAITFSLEYPETLSRGKLLLKTFFGWAYVIIPHGVILALYSIAVAFVQFIAWWAVLFTAVYPRSMFDFVVSFIRWGIRVNAYLGYFTDVYPPFNGSE